MLQKKNSVMIPNLKKNVLVLGSDEENFCRTVPKDGRSYSPILFSQTVRVLKKINKPGDMIVGFGLLADKIKVWFDLENVDKKSTFSSFTKYLSLNLYWWLINIVIVENSLILYNHKVLI